MSSDKDVQRMNVSCALLCVLSGSRASGILEVSCMYPSMSVRPELWNGQPQDMLRLKWTVPHVSQTGNTYNGCETVVHELKQ